MGCVDNWVGGAGAGVVVVVVVVVAAVLLWVGWWVGQGSCAVKSLIHDVIKYVFCIKQSILRRGGAGGWLRLFIFVWHGIFKQFNSNYLSTSVLFLMRPCQQCRATHCCLQCENLRLHKVCACPNQSTLWHLCLPSSNPAKKTKLFLWHGTKTDVSILAWL